jgi:hypothetical protein
MAGRLAASTLLAAPFLSPTVKKEEVIKLCAVS